MILILTIRLLPWLPRVNFAQDVHISPDWCGCKHAAYLI
jgi:hypothetical protein